MVNITKVMNMRWHERILIFEDKRKNHAMKMGPDDALSVTDDFALAAEAYWHKETVGAWIPHEFWDRQEDRRVKRMGLQHPGAWLLEGFKKHEVSEHTERLYRTSVLLGLLRRDDDSRAVRIQFTSYRPTATNEHAFRIEVTVVFTVRQSGPSQFRVDIANMQRKSYNPSPQCDDVPEEWLCGWGGYIRRLDFLQTRYCEERTADKYIPIQGSSMQGDLRDVAMVRKSSIR